MEQVSPANDELSALLRTVNVRSAVYCLSDLGAPWGFRVEASPEPKFHIVLRGAGVVSSRSETCDVGAGDVVLLPMGDEHVVQDSAGSRAPALRDVLTSNPLDAEGRLTYGGSGPRTQLLCGSFDLDASAQRLLSALPRTTVLKAPTMTLDGWLTPLSALLNEPRVETSPGAHAVFAKVADVFLTDVLRHYLANAQPEQRLPLLDDPAIAESVRLLRDKPEAPWTLEGLATRAGMSRTAFVTRFREVVGQPPITYLSSVRLSRAAGHLASSSAGIARIARLVGFSSEASFSKAFKRQYGVAPGAFRAQQQRGELSR